MTIYPPEPFIKPRYDEGGFASLPKRISDYLLGGDYAAVVFFLIDGFGWRFFDRFQEMSFLKQASTRGRVEKLTSQFPSTTSAHLTTFHSGQPVGVHGIFEWNYYEPLLDAVIAPLLFSFAGTTERDTLKQVQASPGALYPKHTLYNGLSNHGVRSTLFQHQEYTPSTYSNALFKGAQAVGFKSLAEAMVNLGLAMQDLHKPSFYYLYYEKIDAISHDYGPGSLQVEAEIQSFLVTMETLFKEYIKPSGRTLFVLTADHGQCEVDPATTIYLNQEARFAGLPAFLSTDRAGNLVVPGGSCRDFFLYIKPGMVEEAFSFLSTRLDGRAQVRKVAELIADGYFGPKVSSLFRARAGDLVILPYRGEAVWWYEKNRFSQKYRGHHGGLTPQEMEIPLLLWEM